jgi:hypothetical protein
MVILTSKWPQRKLQPQAYLEISKIYIKLCQEIVELGEFSKSLLISNRESKVQNKLNSIILILYGISY